MSRNKNKYNYYKKEDLVAIDALICEAKEGLENPKRTWKDVPKNLKDSISKGFPAITGVAVGGVAFIFVLKETKNLFKAVIASVIAMLVALGSFFLGKKRQDGVTEAELVKYHEVVKYQNEIINKQNARIKSGEERENKLLKIIKKKDKTPDSDAYLDYLSKIGGSLTEVAQKLEEDLVLEGVAV